jgi:hypothetical protein
MVSEELSEIIRSHAAWLAGERGGVRANLSWANLYKARLEGSIGVAHLPINDPRGYRCVAVWTDDQWIIYASCRRFTVSEAREHWGPGYAGDRDIGDKYIAALSEIEQWSKNQ